MILEEYLIGTAEDGATIFWYADINYNLCLSKNMQFFNENFSISDHCAAEESGEEDEEEVQCVDLEPVANIDELFDNENATKEFKV